MNCPACGKGMERGRLLTDYSRGLFFLPSEVESDAVLGLFVTRKKVEGSGGIVLDGPYNSKWPNRSELTACVCRNCRKILVDY